MRIFFFTIIVDLVALIYLGPLRCKFSRSLLVNVVAQMAVLCFVFFRTAGSRELILFRSPFLHLTIYYYLGLTPCKVSPSPLHMFTLGQLDQFPFPLLSIVSVLWTSYFFKSLKYKSFSLFFLLTDADIVCSRAKNHYPPGGFDTETATQTSQSSDLLERQRRAYMPLNAKQANVMYFMVSDLVLVKIFVTHGFNSNVWMTLHDFFFF